MSIVYGHTAFQSIFQRYLLAFLLLGGSAMAVMSCYDRVIEHRVIVLVIVIDGS